MQVSNKMCLCYIGCVRFDVEPKVYFCRSVLILEYPDNSVGVRLFVTDRFHIYMHCMSMWCLLAVFFFNHKQWMSKGAI